MTVSLAFVRAPTVKVLVAVVRSILVMPADVPSPAWGVAAHAVPAPTASTTTSAVSGPRYGRIRDPDMALPPTSSAGVTQSGHDRRAAPHRLPRSTEGCPTRSA